jgi:hypothetical protein
MAVTHTIHEACPPSAAFLSPNWFTGCSSFSALAFDLPSVCKRIEHLSIVCHRRLTVIYVSSIAPILRSLPSRPSQLSWIDMSGFTRWSSIGKIMFSSRLFRIVGCYVQASLISLPFHPPQSLVMESPCSSLYDQYMEKMIEKSNHANMFNIALVLIARGSAVDWLPPLTDRMLYAAKYVLTEL